MTHPTPPLSGEILLLDDEDVILLTDEIPPAENHDMIEIRQIAGRSEPQEVLNLPETAKEKPAFIDLTDVIEVADSKTKLPTDFSVLEKDITKPPEAEYQVNELQRLIDEVVHDSQVPPQDFSGIPSEISEPKDAPVVKDDSAFPPQDKINVAMDRVIRNLFAERIESILEEVITTTVNREIENLKTALLDYLTSGKIVHKVKS